MTTDLTTAVLEYCAELERDRRAAERPEVCGGDDAELAFNKEEWAISRYATFIERDRAEGRPAHWSLRHAPGVGDEGDLAHVPALRIVDGALFVRLGRLPEEAWISDAEERFYNPWQRVGEVARLRARGLVILDAEADVFVMTEEQYNSQV
jgi:hypothetical protein